MARAFITQFHHHNGVYTAVIMQFNNAVRFYVPDESLHHIIPDGRFSYNLEQGLQIDSPALNPLRNLIMNIISAMELKTPKTHHPKQ